MDIEGRSMYAFSGLMQISRDFRRLSCFVWIKRGIGNAPLNSLIKSD